MPSFSARTLNRSRQRHGTEPRGVQFPALLNCHRIIARKWMRIAAAYS
jgi:hypothetical protein